MSPQDRSNPDVPMPTAAEADILAVLWRLGPATVREVHHALEKDRDYNTTLTQMRLMAEKGLLVRSERFRSHVYEPASPKNQMQTKIAGDLLKRIFGGSPTGLISERAGRSADHSRRAGRDSPYARRTGWEDQKEDQVKAFQILATQPWIERLGMTLLHLLWQGAIIAAVYAA